MLSVCWPERTPQKQNVCFPIVRAPGGPLASALLCVDHLPCRGPVQKQRPPAREGLWASKASSQQLRV